MRGFEREKDTDSWARQKGITINCRACGTAHDAHIECPKYQQVKSKKKKGIFDSVILPDARK